MNPAILVAPLIALCLDRQDNVKLFSGERQVKIAVSWDKFDVDSFFFDTAVLTIHKLITLTPLVFLAVTAYRRQQVIPLDTFEWIALTIAILLFVGTIASGGLLSTGKAMPAAVLRLHQLAPFLTVLATAVALYALFSKAAASVASLN